MTLIYQLSSSHELTKYFASYYPDFMFKGIKTAKFVKINWYSDEKVDFCQARKSGRALIYVP